MLVMFKEAIKIYSHGVVVDHTITLYSLQTVTLITPV